MRWLKGFFQKDTALSLTLQELPDWLDQRSRLHFDLLEKNIGKLYGEINQAKIDLGSDLAMLESAGPDGSTPPRLLKAGMASRDVVTRQIRMLMERIEPPRGTEISSAMEFHTAVIRHFERTMQKLERPRRYLGALFPLESEKVTSSLGDLGRLLHQIGVTINEKSDDLLAFNTARELLSEIQDFEVKIKEIRKLIEKDEEMLDLSRKATVKLEQEFSLRSSRNELQDLAGQREALDEKRRETSQIEAEMADQIAPLTKALSRLAKQDSSERLTLSPDCRRVLDLFLRSPQEVQDNEISLLMAELRTHVEKDHLGIKGKKKEKILRHIDHLLKTGSLEKTKARHSTALAALLDMEQRYSVSISEASRMEELIRQSKEQTIMLEERISQNQKDLAKKEEEITRKLSQLSLKLEEITGSKVEIL